MVATVRVFFDFGGVDGTPGTEQDTNGLGPPNIRFKTNDNATIDTNDPIPIPVSGTNRSYWKSIYLKITGGSFTQVDNVKFYTDGGGFGTGITTYVGDELPTKSSISNAGYYVATGTAGTTGTEMVAGHPTITAKTDAFTYTSGSPKTVSISEAGNVLNGSGETTNYLVFQVDVGTTASAGDLSDETWTYQYDEI